MARRSDVRQHRGPVPVQPTGTAGQRRATRISNCIRFKFYEQGESWQPTPQRQAIAMCHEMARQNRLRDDGTYIRVHPPKRELPKPPWGDHYTIDRPASPRQPSPSPRQPSPSSRQPAQRRGRRTTARAAVDDAVELFPAEFGLRDHPGLTFSIAPHASYVGGDGRVYLSVWTSGARGWRPFRVGTVDQLRSEVTAASSRGLRWLRWPVELVRRLP